MKKFKKVLTAAISITMLATTVLTGCGGGASSGGASSGGSAPAADSGEKYIIRYASVNPATDNKNLIVLKAWANWLNEKSGGRIELEPHYSNEACKAEDALTATKNGIVDIAEYGSGYWGSDFPVNSSLVLPMVYNWCDSWTWSYCLDDLRAKYPQFETEWSDKGVTLIGWTASGSSNFFTGKGKDPVYTLEDFKGRISNCFSNYEKLAVQELGGTPEMLAPTDVYDALSKGVLDICNVPYTGSHALSVRDAASSITEINLGTCVWGLVMNNDVLASMPEDLQALFTDDANRTMLRNWYNYQFVCDELNYKAEDVASGQFEIITLDDAEKARWKEKMDPIYEDWIKEVDATGADGKQLLADLNEASAKYDFETYQRGMDVSAIHDELEKYYGEPLPEQYVTTIPEK